MKHLLLAVAALVAVAQPASARVIEVSGSGTADTIFNIRGGTTSLPQGAPFSINFSFDSDSLQLLGSTADSAGYRFETSSLVARIGDYEFRPASSFGTISFLRGFGFFGGSSSERSLTQTFSFRGLPDDAPFSLPGGLLRTNLSFASVFRYGTDVPPVDAGALTDPALAARGTFTFDGVPGSGRARAGAFGPASGEFVVAAVPETSTWALLILGFGMVGAALRRRRVATMVPA